MLAQWKHKNRRDMAKREHRIAYKAGITRTPSDFLCEDGELAECINLTTDHEELKVAPQPEVMFEGASKAPLLYVHENNNYKNYITQTGTSLDFFTEAGVEDHIDTLSTSTMPLITHIGNILIVSNSDGMRYYLWKPDTDSYQYLGDKIPEPKMEFAMVFGKFFSSDPSCTFWDSQYAPNSVLPDADWVLHVGIQELYNNVVIGMYSKFKKDAAENELFLEPFVIRYALELNDGSYAQLSEPIMMFPSITNNCRASYDTGDYIIYFDGYSCQLLFKSSFDYTEWDDLVKRVVVFVSAGVNIYDLSIDQAPQRCTNPPYRDPEDLKTFHDYISANVRRYGVLDEHTMKYHADKNYSGSSGNVDFLPLINRNPEDILYDMQAVSVFYKLFDAGIRGRGSWESSRAYIKPHVLENLTTQDQLNTDDYYSRCSLFPQFMMSYNNRLHLSNVSRGFFEGHEVFLPFDNDTIKDCVVYVYIKTSSGTKVVKHAYQTYEKLGIYFFYPDPRAYKAIIFLDDAWLCTLDLEEHPGLNGAYYMRLPTEADNAEQSGTTGEGIITIEECDTEVNMAAEPLSNQLFTSEVNNPFVFTSKGNKTIGTGRIIALASLTTAISQGQFGQHPVIVFSTDGIWAMEVTKEGYLDPAQPMSREVCINANTILETDGAVFFASKKGLMIIVGNQSGIDVRCVSSQMNGKAFSTATIPSLASSNDWGCLITSCADTRGFLQFIRDSHCFLAYDYIDNRILIINPSYSYSYLFNMEDSSVSKLVIPSSVVRSVRSYPDHLLQSSDGKVWSLYDKKDETELSVRQRAFLLSRPMKMSGPVSVKWLRELVNVGCWDKDSGSSVKTLVFVSDDLVDWYKMESRFGAAAKYFRIALYVNMLPTERLSGTIYWDQERRDENARV